MLTCRKDTVHVGQAGGHWQPTSAGGLATLKANPLGLQKTYGLQVVPQADGSAQSRVVRLDVQGLHQELPAGSSTPRFGTVADVPDVRLTALAAGRIRDCQEPVTLPPRYSRSEA